MKLSVYWEYPKRNYAYTDKMQHFSSIFPSLSVSQIMRNETVCIQRICRIKLCIYRQNAKLVNILHLQYPFLRLRGMKLPVYWEYPEWNYAYTDKMQNFSNSLHLQCPFLRLGWMDLSLCWEYAEWNYTCIDKMENFVNILHLHYRFIIWWGINCLYTENTRMKLCIYI
jgi:hypothetical protein